MVVNSSSETEYSLLLNCMWFIIKNTIIHAACTQPDDATLENVDQYLNYGTAEKLWVCV